MSTTTEDHSLLDQLPAVINLQTTLLKQWCTEHSWTNLQLSKDYKISAFPPGSFNPSPLPKEAFTQIERLGDIFHELRELQGLKSLKQKTTKVTLLSSIACIPIAVSYPSLKIAIDTSNFPEIVHNIFDFSIILFLVIPIINGSFALHSWQKYRKVRRKLANKLTTDFLESIKDIDEGGFMKMINSSVAWRESN